MIPFEKLPLTQRVRYKVKLFLFNLLHPFYYAKRRATMRKLTKNELEMKKILKLRKKYGNNPINWVNV